MKRIVLTAAALAAFAVPALAADLPSRAVAPAPAPMMVSVYDWTGFYIGANGGYGSNRACWGNFNGVGIAEGCNSKSGGMFGGEGGYRWQAGQFVFGLEAQGDWANLRASLPSTFVPGGTCGAIRLRNPLASAIS